jgi:LAS superfamily LD-carboxypeptidase LdcB
MSGRWVPKLLGRMAIGAALIGAVLAFASCLTRRAQTLPPPPPAPPASAPVPPPPGLEWRGPVPAACRDGPQAAAAQNARTYETLAWSPFRRQEAGWAIYETLIAHEIRTGCPAGSAGFAAALAVWQSAHRLAPTGVVDEASFLAMKAAWQQRRPIFRATGDVCPDPPADSELALAAPADGYRGTVVRLRPAALAAYQRMAADARRDPQVAADPEALTIFSAFRTPEYDAARCRRDQNCDGITRAACSPHRTGLAMDIYLGHAPGYRPDSSADPNRLFMARSAAYRWLVAHAGAYGFVNYPFEPWHWEYVGG